MNSKAKLLFVVSALGLATLVLGPVQFLANRFEIPAIRSVSRRLPMMWHRIAASLIGLRVHQSGNVAGEKCQLLVANHVSWLDIVALSCLAPVSFIAKQEVATIAGANHLARLQRTLFIKRENRRQSGKQASEIAERMLSGDRMVLFAEGTTGDGNRLLPFKSALFGAAHRALRDGEFDEVQIIPVAIRYTRRGGLPLGRMGRAAVAWPGDIELAPHFAAIVGGGPLDVSIRFGSPVSVNASSRRQEIAKATHEEVRKMLEESLCG